MVATLLNFIMAHIDSMAWIKEKDTDMSFSYIKKCLTLYPRRRSTRAKEENEEGEL